MTTRARPASIDAALAGLDRAEDLRDAGKDVQALALYEESIASLIGTLKSENTNALSDAEAIKRKLLSDDGEGRGSNASSATAKLSSAFSTMLGIAKSRSHDSKGSQARAEYDYAQAMAMRGQSATREEREEPIKSVPTATPSAASISINRDADEQSSSRRKRSTLNYAPNDPLVRAVKDELYVDKAQLNTKWDDVVGLTNAKRALQEAAILPMLRPDLYTGLRSPPKGVLLYGPKLMHDLPPSLQGKTMLVRAAVKESKCILFSCPASALTSKWHGEGEKLLRTLFAVAIDAAPSIVFFDEVDALLSSRKGDGSEHEASRRFKTECMTQMDGIVSANEDDVSHRVLVLGATNVPWDLDDAVMRRFQRRIYVPLPDREARKFLLNKLLSKESGRHSLNKRQIEAIVDRMEGYSCSDIVAMAQEAAFGPLRALGGVSEVERCNSTDIRLINKSDFDAALANTKRSVSDALLRKYLVWEEEQGV
ncbi:hypothetical protein ACHAXT_011418 [Thalassiosira profunda]